MILFENEIWIKVGRTCLCLNEFGSTFLRRLFRWRYKWRNRVWLHTWLENICSISWSYFFTVDQVSYLTIGYADSMDRSLGIWRTARFKLPKAEFESFLAHHLMVFAQVEPVAPKLLAERNYNRAISWQKCGF